MNKIPEFVLYNKDLVDKRLNELLLEDNNNIVSDAMKYSTSIGGKRIRPCLVIEFCKACGGSEKDAIDLACAVEMIHTYSLIHDDLPCMDDDDYRRGKPACHIKYGYANALLAGDALLTKAFEVAAKAKLPADRVVAAVSALSSYSGIDGMIGGQVLDLEFEQRNADTKEILDMYMLKTGALLALSAKLGCIAGDADEKHINNAESYAYNLGYAFQITDDILDVIGDEQKLGKPVGSDCENNKNTFVSKVGLDLAKQKVEKYTANAISALDVFTNNSNLIELANYLLYRDY